MLEISKYEYLSLFTCLWLPLSGITNPGNNFWKACFIKVIKYNRKQWKQCKNIDKVAKSSEK